MKQIIGLLLCSFLVVTSCQKEIDGFVERTAGVDSTGKEAVIEYKEVWGSTDNSANDSFVIYYKFDINGLLMEKKSPKFGDIKHYSRDSKGRVATFTQLVSNKDSISTYVYYKDDNSEVISYTISHAKKMGSKILDSTVYVYDAGKLIKTMFFSFPADTAFLGSYYTWSYDTKNNISQLIVYMRDAVGNFVYGYGCDFLYDDKINPFYTTDQVRQCDEWCWSSSHNNVVKQINHYGANAPVPEDYYTISYTYNMEGKPATSLRSGPTIGTSMVHASFNYK